MSNKIFISYRREDSAANALGIGQYLEHHFGRKNVFIDVDMRAGAKFPSVLEQRLAECKVLLALIGPEWLNARDELDQRRLDNSDDWVRLEIAIALKRNITVIPVRVNGAELPSRSSLPEDIRGLLDHQAVSVTIAGFRHEMAGLVRDIRSVNEQRNTRRLVTIGAVLTLLVLVLGAGTFIYKTPMLFDLFTRKTGTLMSDGDIWRDSPGKWVMYAVDNNAIAYYFDPTSLKIDGDKISYSARFPLKPNKENQTPFHGTYEDDLTALDCKKSLSATDGRTVYDQSGKVLYRYERPAQEAFDLSHGSPIPQGSILSLGKSLVCDEYLRRPSVSKDQLTKMAFAYLAPAATGDEDIYFLHNAGASDSMAPNYTLFIGRLSSDRKLADLFSGLSVLGLPATYRTLVEPLTIDCEHRKVQVVKDDYFDANNNWIRVTVPPTPVSFDVQSGSNFDMLLSAVCSVKNLNVAGSYEGMNYTTYKTGAKGEGRASLVVEQANNKVSMTFRTASGGQGKGTGSLSGATANSISLQSTTPDCPGSYVASFDFKGDTVSWSYKGEDCGGAVEGHGMAKKTKS